MMSKSAPTLRDAIAGVHDKMSSLQEELREAHDELATLKNGLAATNIGSLRREVAFYCHPDRGGNGLLMRRLNVLFDFLQGAS